MSLTKLRREMAIALDELIGPFPLKGHIPAFALEGRDHLELLEGAFPRILPVMMQMVNSARCDLNDPECTFCAKTDNEAEICHNMTNEVDLLIQYMMTILSPTDAEFANHRGTVKFYEFVRMVNIVITNAFKQ